MIALSKSGGSDATYYIIDTVQHLLVGTVKGTEELEKRLQHIKKEHPEHFVHIKVAEDTTFSI